jgi:lipopolysaccharide exporter
MTTGEAPPTTPEARSATPPNGGTPDAAGESIKQSAVRGVGWTSFIQVYRISMGLVTTWILAILLGQAALGLVGSAAVIVGFLMMLKDLGTGAAIVQRRNLSDSVLSSIFWTNLILGLVATIGMFLAAPGIAWMLGPEELVPIIQALSIMMLLTGLGTTHQSLLQRELRFSRLAKIETIAITVGAIAGITSALCGAGVWALVFQSLATMGLTTLLALCLHSWRPKLTLNFDDVRSVAVFSLNLSAFNVLNYVVRSADQLLVLRFLGPSKAGIYYLAIKMLLLPLSSINSVLSRVLFPLFAKIQDDDDRLANAFLKVTSTIAMVVSPFVVGFAVMAEPIVRGILPVEWLPVVPLIAALAIVALLQSLSTSVGNLYLAKGRTGLLLLWGLGACVVGVSGHLIGVQFGATGVARAYAIVAALLFLPGILIPLRLIQTPLRAFAAAVWRPILTAFLMGGIVLGCGTLLSVPPLLDIAIRVPLGAVTYVLLSLWINGDHVRQIATLLRSRGGTGPSDILPVVGAKR